MSPIREMPYRMRMRQVGGVPPNRLLRWRRWNRLRASFGRYFWLPCPLCGQMFGGHETTGAAVWWPWPTEVSNGTEGFSICPGHAVRNWVYDADGMPVPDARTVGA